MTSQIVKPIGIIHSPLVQMADAPIQTAMAKGVEGSITILPEFVPALKDLDGFDRIWLLYWFHRSTTSRLVVTPFLDTCEHGVFATRSPARPNPIGLSCVRLLSNENNQLRVSELDILDYTPLLDIKPYVPAFDCFPSERIGWLTEKLMGRVLADNRFEQPPMSSHDGIDNPPVTESQ